MKHVARECYSQHCAQMLMGIQRFVLLDGDVVKDL